MATEKVALSIGRGYLQLAAQFVNCIEQLLGLAGRQVTLLFEFRLQLAEVEGCLGPKFAGQPIHLLEDGIGFAVDRQKAVLFNQSAHFVEFASSPHS